MTDDPQDESENEWSVRRLRRDWKPHKERLSNHPTAIRFHRVCSWLDQAQRLPIESNRDLALIYLWIAFNALYSRWDEERREPQADRVSMNAFVTRTLNLDANGSLENLLCEHRPLVMQILDDEHLVHYYWKEPDETAARRARRARHQAPGWYYEGRWAMLLTCVLERIYLLRCQIMHGAATMGSSLNRDVLESCTDMLGHLLPVLLRIFIDHGANEDWGPSATRLWIDIAGVSTSLHYLPQFICVDDVLLRSVPHAVTGRAL